MARYRDLKHDLEHQLGEQFGPGALGQIDTLARALPRAQVLDRALGALAVSGQEIIPGTLCSRRLAQEVTRSTIIDHVRWELSRSGLQ